MKLSLPIKNVNLNTPIYPSPGSIYISQVFGNDPVVTQDTWFGKFLVKAGEHVYRVLANMDGHNGIDIAAPLGTEIKGNVEGAEAYVIYQNKDAGYGNITAVRIIDGNKNYVQLFGHQQKFEPDIILPWNWEDKTKPFVFDKTYGYVNSTGASTGNHLHWTIQEYDNLGNKLNINNGFGGAIDPFKLMKGQGMHLVKDNGVVYIISGQNEKTKLGIADPETLSLFGDEPIVEEDTSSIPETFTIARGFIINRK